MNICAPATAQGGALSIIRISGPEAITIAARIFRPASGIPLTAAKGQTLHYGEIKEPSALSVAQERPVLGHTMPEQAPPSTVALASVANQPLDQALASVFRAPHSFTGEDSVEFSCHASPYITSEVLRLLCANGCRLAEPGEFTQRAFLNGKLDLSQAEAVADLISSNSAASHRIAMQQMRGGISKELHQLNDQLLHITSLLELELDFADHEELEFADRSELTALADRIIAHLTRLVQSYRTGSALKNGVPVAIVGPTNAGKSTLLNALLRDDRAIVSPIHGTTRDVIEDTITISGILFRFIDTAGIRQTDDQIEALGIERTFSMIDRADIVLLLTAPDCPLPAADREAILRRAQGKTLIPLQNKADLQSVPLFASSGASRNSGVPCPSSPLPISAKTGEGLPALEALLVQTITAQAAETDTLITNARHHAALAQALEAMHRVKEAMSLNLSGDLIAEDLRQVLHHLAEVTGTQITSDQVLQNIFRNFCVGK